DMKLPADRMEGCQRDYAKMFASWETVLKPLMRDPERPKTKIEVTYGEGKGRLEAIAQGFRAIQMLEMLADRAADQFAWPAPFTLEMRSCGEINARWFPDDRKLVLCYELAADFSDLYREFNLTPATKRQSPRVSST